MLHKGRPGAPEAVCWWSAVALRNARLGILSVDVLCSRLCDRALSERGGLSNSVRWGGIFAVASSMTNPLGLTRYGMLLIPCIIPAWTHPPPPESTLSMLRQRASEED